MSFGDGTAEARVAARYAGIDGHVIAAAQAESQAKRDAYGRATAVRYESAEREVNRASGKAVDYLVALSAERFPAVTEASIREWAANVDRSEVSKRIDWLKAQPKVVNSGTGSKTYDVPAGRYAVTGAEGQTVFVKVSIPSEGPFAGRTFVNVQAGDELHRISSTMRNTLLGKIEAAGVEQASKRYGREIGDCGVCGRTLTDATSREAGIGPVCRSKMGW